MEHGAVSMEQGRLRADMDIVHAYAVDHADESADVRWENEPTVRIVVRFVDHVDEHRNALTELVEHPDRLEVGWARFTDARLSEVHSEIRAAGYWQHGLRNSATIDNKARFGFVASAASAAAELHQRYGDLVALTVGVLPYPPAATPHRPPAYPPVTDGSLPVRLALVLDQATITAGDDGSGQLHITNLADTPLDIMTGILVGWVYRPGGHHPASAYNGALTQQGIIVRLDPGETSTQTPVLFGTASYDPTVGYHLPPGPYEVMTALRYQTRHDDGGPGRTFNTRSPRTPLTVT